MSMRVDNVPSSSLLYEKKLDSEKMTTISEVDKVILESKGNEEALIVEKKA